MYKLRLESETQGLPYEFRSWDELKKEPVPGEFWISPTPEHETRKRECAKLMVQKGLSAFRGGDANPITLIVLQKDPTLDDMLAALIAEMLLLKDQIGENDGQLRPAQLIKFAEYAAQSRAGANPGSLPVEHSLAAMYQIVRKGSSVFLDLTQREAAREFGEAWTPFTEVILAACRSRMEIDPFKDVLIQSHSHFLDSARQQLKNDQAMYRRERDAAKHKWWLRVPDEGPLAPLRSALILENPQSRLWKEWARNDPGLGAGFFRRLFDYFLGRPSPEGFEFIGVIESDNPWWTFSTDPKTSVRIGSLQTALQGREEKASGPEAAKDPWVRIFGDTMVAGPKHSASKIGKAELLEAVRVWGGNGRTMLLPPVWKYVAVAAIVLVVAGTMFGRYALAGAPRPESSAAVRETPMRLRPFVHGMTARSETEQDPQTQEKLVPTRDPNGWIEAESNSYRSIKVSGVVKSRDPDRKFPKGKMHVRCQILGEDCLLVKSETLAEDSREVPVSFASDFRTDAGIVIGKVWVSFSPDNNDALLPENITTKFECVENASVRPRLFVVAIGVRDFAGKRLGPLGTAEEDARKLAEFCTKLAPRFEAVYTPVQCGWTHPLINPELNAMMQSIEWACRNPQPRDRLLILISSHGLKAEPPAKYRVVASGRNGQEALVDELKYLTEDYLKNKLAEIRCPYLVVLDTCYSGTANWETQRSGKLGVILTASKDVAESNPGLGNGHGAFSYAFLKVLRGEDAVSNSSGRGDATQGMSLFDLITRLRAEYPRHTARKGDPNRQMGDHSGLSISELSAIEFFPKPN